MALVGWLGRGGNLRWAKVKKWNKRKASPNAPPFNTTPPFSTL